MAGALMINAIVGTRLASKGTIHPYIRQHSPPQPANQYLHAKMETTFNGFFSLRGQSMTVLIRYHSIVLGLFSL